MVLSHLLNLLHNQKKINTMAKKKEGNNLSDYIIRNEVIEKALLNMKIIDLQRACIVRGINFDLMVQKSVGELQSYLYNHWEDKIDNGRLDLFDKWREDFLISRGMPDEPFVRLGFLGKTDEETGEVLTMEKPEVKVEKITKPRRERNEELGIFTGTKKALTYDLVGQGKEIDEITRAVIKKFPEAKEKSIKIWIRKCKAGK